MSAPCVIDPGTVVVDFNDQAQWTADGVQVTSKYQHFRCLDDPNKAGTATKHASTATPATGYITRTGLSLDLSDMTSLRLDYRLYLMAENMAGIFKVGLEFSSTGNFDTKCMQATHGPNTNQMAGYGPTRWLIGLSEWTAVGGESWANTMVACRVAIIPTATNVGFNGSPYIFFDKIVKNPVTSPLVLLSFPGDLTATSDIVMPALHDYGFDGKAFMSIVDYDNVGDATYNSWAQLKALSDAGLQVIPTLTAWLLYAFTDANRHVPPYPAQDDRFAPASDATLGVFIGKAAIKKVHDAIKRIHAFYDLPYSRDIFAPHAGFANGIDMLEAAKDEGFKSYYIRADWNGTSKGTAYHTLPLCEGQLPSWNVATSTATHANVMTAIGEVVSLGRYLHLAYSNIPSNWTEVNLRAELAELRAQEDLGHLRVVSLPEFLHLAMDEDLSPWGTPSGNVIPPLGG